MSEWIYMEKNNQIDISPRKLQLKEEYERLQKEYSELVARRDDMLYILMMNILDGYHVIMKKSICVMLAAILLCGIGILTSCSNNYDNVAEDPFDSQMTAAMADARKYGPHTDAFAREVAEHFNCYVTEFDYKTRESATLLL